MSSPFSCSQSRQLWRRLVHIRVTDVPAIFASFFFGHGETSLRWPWSHALTPLGLNGRLTALGLALNFGDRGLGSSIRTIAYVIKSGNGIITNRGQNAN